MTNDTKVTKKWFLPSDFEKEENYLCNMAKEGWHLIKVKKGLGISKFYFEKGEAKNFSYAVQYLIKDQDSEGYCKAVIDKGWENITNVPYLWNGEWHYYRKECKEHRKEQILNGNESKLGLLKNILRSLWIIGLCLIFSGVSVISNSFETVLGYSDARFSMPFAISILVIYLVIFILYAMILIPLINKISQMNKN